MKFIQEYLELDNSYKSMYIRNNNFIKDKNESIENLFYYITSDVDIVLNKLNISTSKAGYRYWKDAIFICIVESNCPVSICKDIYPAIAKKYNKTETSVERAMRVCFEDVMYNISKKEKDIIIEFLNNYLLNPHNSELLFRIVDLIVSKMFQELKINFYKFNNQ